MKRIVPLVVVAAFALTVLSGCAGIGIGTPWMYGHVDRVASQLQLGKGLQVEHENDYGGLYDAQASHQIVLDGKDSYATVVERLIEGGFVNTNTQANPRFEFWEGDADGKQVDISVQKLARGTKFEENTTAQTTLLTAKQSGVSVVIT